MEWMLRLVGTGIDDQSRSFDVMEISLPDGLGDLANLGLTLAEAKQLLERVQQDIVAAQADNRAMVRPDCQSCGRTCHVKDWRPHRIATLFGEVRVRLARNAGFSVGIFAGSTFSGCSSSAIVRGPAFSAIVIGAISALNAPLCTAFRARVSVSIA